MNFKIFLLSIWIPQYFLKKELNTLAKTTLNQLDHLLQIYAPQSLSEIPELKLPFKGNLEDIRAKMAQEHNNRVSILSDYLGPEETVKIARPLMFKTGYQLGLYIKTRIGLKDDFNDLKRAAKILYRALGIEFRFHEGEDCITHNSKYCIIIKRCSLSQYYLPLTCQVLSGADEGVVKGLNSRAKMTFKEKITEGAPACIAAIHMEKDNKK